MPETAILNDEHRAIAQITADIPGILMPGDHEALYETAFYHGDVILEIGAYAGKSAVIELLGAKANTERMVPPVYFGVDVDALAVFRTWNALRNFGLQNHAAVYLGNLESFVAAHPISPSMVFLDGDHLYQPVRTDLDILRRVCLPGTAILCHDYEHDPSQELEAKPAIDDFVKEGHAEFIGARGARCALIRLTETAQGRAPARCPVDFDKLREKWILDAATQLSDSWLKLRDDNVKQKAAKVKLEEKLAAEKKKTHIDEFKHVLGQRLYWRDKKAAKAGQAEGG